MCVILMFFLLDFSIRFAFDLKYILWEYIFCPTPTRITFWGNKCMAAPHMNILQDNMLPTADSESIQVSRVVAQEHIN